MISFEPTTASVPAALLADPDALDAERLDHACDLLGFVAEHYGDPIAMVRIMPEVRAFLRQYGDEP